MRLATVQKRNAFTLVELLVVIAIIVILMALTVGVISKVYVYLDEVKVNTEVGRLSQACEQFKSTFGRYPPARIILCENGATYATLISGAGPTGELAAYSVEYLSSIFPGINLRGIEFPAGSGTYYGWDWSGRFTTNPPTINGVVTQGCTQPGASRVFDLEGEEALVFFLGGMRTVNTSVAPIKMGATAGFNTDKTRPTVITTTTRLGPFFEFDAGRLAPGRFSSPVPTPAGPVVNLFEVYRDVYSTPYAYFLARTPGMSNYFHPGAQQLSGYTTPAQQYLSDCYSLTANYVPLLKQVSGASVSYHKGDSYQIVSAGKDKRFGSGGLWNQADPEQSNFNFMTNVNFTPPVATAIDKQETYDNITNVTGGRVVPK